jgi:hypothetical protein
MKTYKVSLARVEHVVYQIEVEANDKEEAEEVAWEMWEEDDSKFRSLGCVHADEFIDDIEEVQS